MPADPMSSRMRRPTSSMVAMAASVTAMLVTEVMTVIVRASASLKPTLPQRRAVVEDHGDADGLLEDRQHDADPDDRLQAERRAAQVGEAGVVALVGLDAALDLAEALVDARLEDLAEDLARALLPPLPHQVARRLGDGERQRAVDDAGQRFADERPAPGLEPEGEVLPGAAGDARQQRIDEQGDEDADDDRELLQRPEAPADGGGGELGDVRRCDDRRRADAEAADDAPGGHASPVRSRGRSRERSR